VPLDEPWWWYERSPGLIATGLAPVAGLYGWFVKARFSSATPYRSRLPVVCAGNFTAGGSGKTPLARHLCECVRSLGKRPVVLSRGYGGRLPGPHWVRADDQAGDTGDEPLLLARTSPVLIARDRVVGAQVIEAAANSDVIIMDDGLQNPRLHKDLAIAVVDGSRGLGNGRVIPAGPLRAPLASQFPLAHAIVVNNTTHGVGDEIESRLKENFDGPMLRSATVPAEDANWLRGQRVVAWAGIAGPTRFFDLLEQLGAQIAGRFMFRDHMSPTPHQAAAILHAAETANAVLVCTEKDYVRLPRNAGPLADLAAATKPLPIRLVFGERDRARLANLVRSAIM
jgi:tetraacyldisaccharide 4'-kinase